ncbi:hypothetical protein C8F01DRAFT_1375030 [Mycena amicta]|nr:hypothetical protein C8F01DRAFT_1375030 [Mycena amicta]
MGIPPTLYHWSPISKRSGSLVPSAHNGSSVLVLPTVYATAYSRCPLSWTGVADALLFDERQVAIQPHLWPPDANTARRLELVDGGQKWYRRIAVLHDDAFDPRSTHCPEFPTVQWTTQELKNRVTSLGSRLASISTLFGHTICFLPRQRHLRLQDRRSIPIDLHSVLPTPRPSSSTPFAQGPLPFATTGLPATSSEARLPRLPSSRSCVPADSCNTNTTATRLEGCPSSAIFSQMVMAKNAGDLSTSANLSPIPSSQPSPTGECVSFTLSRNEPGGESGPAGSTIAEEELCDRDTIHIPSAKTTTARNGLMREVGLG